ncbi:MAG: NYN domain-containing protein, partial [Candidatus Zixiibacteriota bacterium]
DIYIRALRYAGIDIVVGRFKRLKKKVVLKNEASYKNYTTSDGNIPGSIFYGYTFEEKKTDVNIACSIISKATNNEYDTALLLSGDTDFEPAISTVQQLFKKDIIVAVPNKKIAGSIKSIVPKGHCVTIREKDLACSLLPDPIKLPDGKIITCPLEWHL